MKIQAVSSFSSNNFNNGYKAVSFGSASDITLEYVLKKHFKYLPERIAAKIKEILSNGLEQKPLYELHNEVYKGLFDAKTLDELKQNYTEFGEVKDVVSLRDNRSKAIKAVQKIMPLEDFTLDYLKRLYKPTAQDKLVEEYGFTNRNLLMWLNEKLGIKKLSGSYIQLLKMSNEEENSRIAELSRRAIYADAEAQKYRLQKAAEAHRTPEYRAKKRQEMKDYYKRNPETAKRTGIISKLTWERCPEIKEALSKYTKTLGSYIRRVLSKKQAGASLTSDERRIAFGYYRGFWEKYQHLKQLYRERRMEVINELKTSI